jgi:hypothetical protein
MFAIVSALLRYLLSWLRPKHELALENLALRHQIGVLNRQAPKPRLQGQDRLFWVVLKGCWPNWRAALILFQPETVSRFVEFGPAGKTDAPGLRASAAQPLLQHLNLAVSRVPRPDFFSVRLQRRILLARLGSCLLLRFLPQGKEPLWACLAPVYELFQTCFGIGC